MPAIATLEELKGVEKVIEEIKKEYPEAWEDIKEFLKAYRKYGYKNICKIFIGEETPESLKE